MKKLITCASLAAVGTMTVGAQPIGEPSTSKTWSVAAKLRGFYDSNYNTGVDNPVAGGRPGKAESWGIDVRPSVGFNMVQDTTVVNLKVAYGLRWYEDRTANEIDQDVLADLFLGHDLNESTRLEVKDQFVYSNEPTVLATGAISSYYRTDGTNIRNYSGVNLLKDFSEVWGIGLGYNGTVYNYEQEGDGSRSALLDRWESKFNIDARRHFQPTTTGLIGYQFGLTDMTSGDRLASPAAAGLPPALVPTASFRNYYSHYGYVGVDHSLTSKLAASARVGVQYNDYYNASDDQVGPYAEASLSYWYQENSRVMLGVLTGIYPTDVAVAPGSASVTLGSQATMVYAAVSHAITSRLTAYVRGAWQMSDYQGGAFDGQTDYYVNADVNLTYDLTKNVALEAGYLFDDLSSDIAQRGYDRHRGYAGVKATY
ncbi:MAG: outer membrane beta-barrel protein [Verrucomicrobiae bacterium]|nr:outer membrane beta-barrel protein [Verrucomicrobiae bacterium]